LIELSVIIGKMNELKSLDKGFSVFGSDSHNYQLNDPLPEKELLEYEKRYGLVLPKEYREFLYSVGDGGFGPFYGLLPLRDNDGTLQYSDSTDDVGLDKAFPFTRNNPLCLNDDEELTNEREDFFYKRATQGVKCLCHEGCGRYNVLVVKGKESGTVWHLDFSGGGGWCGVLPLIDNNCPLGFSDWYNIWLDREIKSLNANEHDIWGYST
jgi:hypothetical protein